VFHYRNKALPSNNTGEDAKDFARSRFQSYMPTACLTMLQLSIVCFFASELEGVQWLTSSTLR
jgi:hypothetical protein